MLVNSQDLKTFLSFVHITHLGNEERKMLKWISEKENVNVWTGIN